MQFLFIMGFQNQSHSWLTYQRMLLNFHSFNLFKITILLNIYSCMTNGVAFKLVRKTSKKLL